MHAGRPRITTRFHVVPGSLLAVAALCGAVTSFAATYSLISWAITDMRMVVVSLRESTPIIAMIMGLLIVWVTSAWEANVVLPTPAERPIPSILAAQVMPTSAMFVVGLCAGLLPASITALQHPYGVNEIVAFGAVVSSVFGISGLALAQACLVVHPARVLLVPIGTIILIGIPEWATNTILSSTHTPRSMLSVSAFWDLRMPQTGFTFNCALELARILFFMALFLACIKIVEMVRHRHGVPGSRGFVLPVMVLTVVAIATWSSPILVVPSSDSLNCKPTGNARVCLYEQHESLRNSVEIITSSITLRLPPLESEWLISERSSSDGGAVIPPPQRDETKWRLGVEQAVVGSLVPMDRCSTETTLSDSDSNQRLLGSVVRTRLMVREDPDPRRRAEFEALVAMDDQEFGKWWQSRSTPILNCSLQYDDFPR